MNLQQLTRSAALAVLLAGLVTFLPGARKIQLAEAAGIPVPLPRFIETALPAAQDPSGYCTSRVRIVQDCAFGSLPGMRAQEQAVIERLIALHQLPADAPTPAAPPEGAIIIGGGTPDQGPQDNASRLLSWERDTLRAYLFDRLVSFTAKAPSSRTDEEREILAALAALVQRQRMASATEAKRLYELWRSDPCTFKPPAGLTYTPPLRCSVPNALSGIFENPPSLEQFQAYGAASATQRFSTDADLQAAAREAAKAYGLLGGVGAAGVAAAGAYGFVTGTALGATLAKAISPFGGVGVAAGAGSSTGVVALGLAGAAAVVVICIIIAVIAGITTFTAAQIPTKLDAAIEAARTAPDVDALLATEAGTQELFSAYLVTTVPAANSPRIVGGLNGWAPVPAARPDDAKFLLEPGPSRQVSAELIFKGWERTGRARLSEGWFVDERGLTLHLDYVNHAGERWTAWRFGGDRFLHTTVGQGFGKAPFLSDLIRYQDPNGVNRTARILVPGLARPAANPTFSPEATVAGWHNAPVTVTWNWVDNAGVGLDPAACPATTMLAPGEIASVTCTDLAGNRGAATASARVDMRAPAFTGPPTISPSANAAGWHNTDVTVSFSCSDGEQAAIFVAGTEPSGIGACGPTQKLTGEGRDQSVTGIAIDLAGNTATQTATGINIDMTPPRFDAPAEQTIGGTSATGGRVVAPRAIDNLDPEPQVTCTPAVGSPLPLGPARVTCTATDAAGNTSEPASFTLNVVPGCNGIVATIVAQPGVPTAGTPGRDVIVGTDGPDEIHGGDGDDLICGGGGNDRIYGEGGDDTIYGEGGDDLLDGGPGQDYLDGGPGNDTLLGGPGNDWLEDREGMNQVFDGGGGVNRCIGVSTAAPNGTVTNCQTRTP